jgi:hypothetical protein
VTTQPSLTPAAFAAKWHGVTTTEKASAQEHFIDLCRMLGQPTPHDADPTGEGYAFEKRVSKAAGELEQQAATYARAIEAAGREQATIDTYYRHAMFFIRWLRGEFRPGARLG